VRQFIAIVEPSHSWDLISAADQDRLLEALAATDGGLDLRIPLTGSLAPYLAVADQARAAGCRVRAHSWVGTSDKDGVSTVRPDDGTRQGLRARAQLAILQPERWAANAENAVHRGTGGRWHPHAVAYLRELAESVGYAHGAAIDYCGFPDPSLHYGAGAIIPPDVCDLFDGLALMAYQSSAGALATRIRRALARWPLHTQGRRRPITAWHGPGRDAPTGGEPKALLRALRLVPEAEIEEVVWYVGLRQSGDRSGPHQPWLMLHHGRPGYPPLTEVIPWWQEQWT